MNARQYYVLVHCLSCYFNCGVSPKKCRCFNIACCNGTYGTIPRISVLTQAASLDVQTAHPHSKHKRYVSVQLDEGSGRLFRLDECWKD